jgi:Flp pilus assembly protein CpaB
MRAGGRILMIFGVVLGIIAAVATFFIITRSAPPEGGDSVLDTETVIVAFQTIEPWQPIPVDAIGPNEYPIPIPADAVLAQMPNDAPDPTTGITETVSGQEFVAGKISNTRIYPGQIIVTSQLVNKELEETRLGLGGDLSYIIPEGQVAIALNVDALSSIAGGLKSGDQVDIIGSYLIEAENEEEDDIDVTQIFMQKVQILRVGPWAVTEEGTEEQQGSGIVTILLEPQQALELKKITEDVRWQFVLRSITDQTDFVTDPVDDAYLIETFTLTP